MAETLKNITLTGFDELIDAIKKAEGNSEAAAERAAMAGANVYESTLRAECSASNVPGDLVALIRKEVKSSGNGFISVKVGWAVPGYDRRNPAPAFKVIFLNYGTGRRMTRQGGQRVKMPDGSWRIVSTNRGAITKRGFIARAKSRSKARIKAAQKSALEEILKELTS